jgi:predicted AlkP superfamily pyrophosphatase or phosphodiesterase
MRKALFCLLSAALCGTAATPKPKLIVTVVVDQFRYDYLTRYRTDFTGGFHRLLTDGAVFTNANYQHVPAVTAVGHSTILSGAIPSISGIVANEWFDAQEKGHVTSVSDPATRLVGGKDAVGSSPHRLLVSTIGDEIKIVAGPKSRVIGVSLKDRSAILPAGHMADGAFWFDVSTGNFVTSTWYMKELPAWAREFNALHTADQLKGTTWLGHKLPDDVTKLYSELEKTPSGNDLVESFAERALAAEQLGKHEGTDLFTVSYSSNDYVGHEYGPESPEARDTAIATDRLLGKLLAAVEQQVGAGNYLVVLTADHGAPPLPELNASRHMPGGRLLPAKLKEVVQTALVKRYGPGEWVSGNWDLSIYLNRELIALKKLDRSQVQKEAARALLADVPHIFRVYTLDEVARGETLRDEITQRVVNGYNLQRGPDVEVIPDPYWMVRSTPGETHASPFSYDLHVPVIFMGWGIKPGRYNRSIVVNDIAPTLATMLDIETPSGSVGHVLTEILVE